MAKYIIERNIPGASKLSAKELHEISAKSNSVIRELGPDVQWVHSYVAGDKIYCIYNAKNPEIIREHARRGGFPADLIAKVVAIIDPTTGEAP
jgi:hypothetical protein